MKDTLATILKRLEAKLDEQVCPADKETYDKHCSILAKLEDFMPRLETTLEKFDVKLGVHEKDITIIKTERKILLTIAGIIGAIAGWFGKYL